MSQISKPLTPALRQQRRRAKLKAEKEEQQYSPEPFIAEAIYKLSLSKEISEDLLNTIIESAFVCAKETFPEMPRYMGAYVLKRIKDFLNA